MDGLRGCTFDQSWFKPVEKFNAQKTVYRVYDKKNNTYFGAELGYGNWKYDFDSIEKIKCNIAFKQLRNKKHLMIHKVVITTEIIKEDNV